MEKFEYQVWEFYKGKMLSTAPDKAIMQSKLNELGAEGWEVVSSSSTHHSNAETRSVVVILKRKIVD